jgi:hypothetical protein
VILYCARRTTTASSWGFREHRGLLEPPFTPPAPGAQDHTGFPNLFLSLLGAAWSNPQLRATFLTCPPTGRFFSPALLSDCSAIDFPRHAISRARAFRFSTPLFKGVAKAALDCAHRTSTVSSCAFCEQEGHLVAPFPSLDCPFHRLL